MGQAPSASFSPSFTSPQPPSSVAMSMALNQTTIYTFSDEILLNICRQLRTLEQSSFFDARMISHRIGPPERDYFPCATLVALSLTSRRFNGPATQALYENVELDRFNTRQFLYTIVSSPGHASLVRFIRTRRWNSADSASSDEYRPRACYHVSPKTVDESIKAFAKTQELEDDLQLTGKQKRIVPDRDLDQLLVALAAIHLKEVDLEVHHPGPLRHEDRSVIEPNKFAHGLMPCRYERSNFGHRLISLTLRAPHSISKVELHKVVSVLGLKNLRTLALDGLRSSTTNDSHHVISKALRKLKVPCKVRNLYIRECSLSASDLSALIKQCSVLEHLAWRCIDRTAYDVVDIYRDSCIKARDVVAALTAGTKSIKSLTFDHLEQVTDWVGVDRRLSVMQTHDIGRGTQREYIGPADFTKLSDLQTLEVTAPVIIGLPEDPDDKLDFANNIPGGLKELWLRMPHDPFPTRMYNRTHGTRHWKMIASLCRALNELTLDLPLRSVRLLIPHSWPKLSALTAKKLAEAVTSVHRVHLVLDGIGPWKLDSEILPPPVQKKPRGYAKPEREEVGDWTRTEPFQFYPFSDFEDTDSD